MDYNLDVKFDETFAAMAKERNITVEELEQEMQSLINESWNDETKSFKYLPHEMYEVILRMINDHQVPE